MMQKTTLKWFRSARKRGARQERGMSVAKREQAEAAERRSLWERQAARGIDFRFGTPQFEQEAAHCNRVPSGMW
jgi:hypothetical protein